MPLLINLKFSDFHKFFLRITLINKKNEIKYHQ